MSRRPVAATHTFADPADFGAFKAAEAWLVAHGYSYGPSSADNKIAVLYGNDIAIGKWRTLSRAAIAALDGILAGPVRSGPLTLTLYSVPPSPSGAQNEATE